MKTVLKITATTSSKTKEKAKLTDFVIDTLAIKKYVSQTNKTTYSFRVYPIISVSGTNKIYNLVYRKVNERWEKALFLLTKKKCNKSKPKNI